MFNSFGFGSNKPSKPPKAVPPSSGAKDDAEGTGTIKPKPGALPAATEIESVAKRSVKISFPKGTKTARAIEDDIYRAASMFGTIMDIRIKGKNAVVLYSSVADADRCVSSWADTSLAAQDYKVKSMGLAAGGSLNQSMDSAAGGESMEVMSLSNSNSNASLDKQGGSPAALYDSPGLLVHTYTGGIAFDGSVVESNQTMQVLELEDVSNFDRTVNLSQASLDVSAVHPAGRASPPVVPASAQPHSQHTSAIALDDSVGSVGSTGNPYSPPKQDTGSWKVAEKPKTPPARPPRSTPTTDRDTSAGAGAGAGGGEYDSSGSSEAGSKKALTPKQVRVGRDVELDASKGAGSANNTYISSANDTSNNQSDSVSMYNSNYDGDYNSTLLSNKPPSAAKPPVVGSSFAMSVSSTEDGTFLTQAIPNKPLKGSAAAAFKAVTGTSADAVHHAAKGGSRERVNSYGSDSGGGSSDPHKPLFGNILDIPRDLPRHGSSNSSSGVLEGVLHNLASASGGNPQAWQLQQERDVAIEELQQRVRVLEAEARVAARERMDYGDEIRRTEESWSIELTALGIRSNTLEIENSRLREDNQRAKIELAKMVSQVSALEARKEASTMAAGNSRAEADRDAYGALLAQQKLVQVLHAHKEASEAQVAALKAELGSLRKAHKAAAEEGYEWKMKAARMEEELASLQPDAESAAEEGAEERREADSPKHALAEISSRKVLNRELEKYLSLEKSLATPVLAHNAVQNVWKYSARETQFGAFFDMAAESGVFAAENTNTNRQQLHKPFHSSNTAKYSNAIPQHWRSKE